MTSGVLFLHSGLILTRRGCDSAYSAPVAFPPQPGLYSMAHSKTSILQGLLLSSLLHLTLSHDGGKSLAQGEGLDQWVMKEGRWTYFFPGMKLVELLKLCS